ncbi:MAG: phospho-sugar mutase [Spirochaetales bacterium]|nr:phospho-sugar mutase [Spirochaetales bacterium]
MRYNEKDLRQKATLYLEVETEEAFRTEVENELENGRWAELYERFYTTLSFGTAGIRGLLGGGTNRMNTFMVRKVTQGLADYLKTQSDHPSVVIGYDSRHYSDVFAKEAALVLAANGVSVYLFPELRPVPMISYAVRNLKTTAGIAITASHNPSAYNGFKAYWRDGAQVTPPHDFQIADRANAVQPKQIRTITEEKARSNGLLVRVPDKVEESYYNEVLSSIRNMDIIKTSKTLVAYTPLHGSGLRPVIRLFDEVGIDYVTVKEQEQPDGSFPTVKLPNPEDHEAMELVLSLAKKKGADIVLGTDPDADRLGIAIPLSDEKKDYQLLTGNQIAVLLADYLMMSTRQTTKQPVVVKSIVTTDLVKEIVEKRGGVCKDVLTGFKYIANEMALLEGPKGEEQYFLFGCEESYGYLTIDVVRDKDAVSTALVAVEMLSYWKTRGKTLIDRLGEIYREFGYYTERVISVDFEGAAGQEKMAQVMQSFRRRTAGEELVGRKIMKIEDLLNPKEGGLPPSDVVIFHLEGGERVIVRPSGTEPKIKYYLFFSTEAADRAAFDAHLESRVQEMKGGLL